MNIIYYENDLDKPIDSQCFFFVFVDVKEKYIEIDVVITKHIPK